jgi:polar amino acid transport system substrate-binding protein
MKKLHNILLTFTLFFLSACSENKTSETWVVGVSPDNPPYEFVQNGHTVGFDIDLMNEIGKYAGKKIEVKNMELHSVLAALSTKNVEVAISGLTPTPERQEKVDFSIPYFTSKIAILYRSEDKFSSAKDLKDTHIVGAQLGSTWNAIAHELAEKQGFKVSALSSNLMLVEDLKAKRIDAIVLEESQVDKFVEIYPELAKLVLHEFDSIFAIAMPKKFTGQKNNR